MQQFKQGMRVSKLLLSMIVLIMGSSAFASSLNDFMITVKTDNTGGSSDTQFIIGTSGEGYNYNIDCNNDSTPEATAQTGNYTCNYASAGTYTIRIIDNAGDGTGFPHYHNYYDDREKLLSIEQWGTGKWNSMNNSFYSAINVVINATDVPDLSNVKNMSAMFYGATSANPDVSNWNTSSVEDMSHMFDSADSANPDVSNWNTSSVTTMFGMFQVTTSANPDVSHWDTSHVTNMGNMFYAATSANPDVSNWDTSSVKEMTSMFAIATSANPDVSNWDTSSVIAMNSMFSEATSANPDVSHWDTSKVSYMDSMFLSATSANPDVSNWNISSLTDASYMFDNSALSTINYDALLIAWNSQTHKSDGLFSANGIHYCKGEIARQNLIDADNWIISDAGKQCTPCQDTVTELTAYQWKVVSFPCDTGSNGVEALLGDSLGTYGNDDNWVMYQQESDFSGTSSSMVMMEYNDTVVPGKGYWIITDENKTMSIDETLSGLSSTSEQSSSNLGISDGNFDNIHLKDLPNSSSGERLKVMLGNPFPLKFSLENMYFNNSNQGTTYYPMGNATNDTYIEKTVYVHDTADRSGTSYEARVSGTPGFEGDIRLMEGFWVILETGSGENNITYPLEK